MLGGIEPLFFTLSFDDYEVRTISEIPTGRWQHWADCKDWCFKENGDSFIPIQMPLDCSLPPLSLALQTFFPATPYLKAEYRQLNIFIISVNVLSSIADWSGRKRVLQTSHANHYQMFIAVQLHSLSFFLDFFPSCSTLTSKVRNGSTVCCIKMGLFPVACPWCLRARF